MFAEKCCVILLCVFAIFISTDSKSSKRILMAWENLTPCTNFENKETDISKVEVYMSDPTSIRLRGELEIKVDIEKGPLKLTLEVERSVSENSYMPMLSYEIKDLCEKLGEKNQTWTPYIQNLRPIPPNKCPIKKGVYNVERIKGDTANMELKREMIGKYRARVEIFRPDFSIPAGMPTVPIKLCCYYLSFRVESE